MQAALAGRDALVVPVPDWAEGQSRSVLAGLKAAMHEAAIIEEKQPENQANQVDQGNLRPVSSPQFDAVLFLLADQPGVSPNCSRRSSSATARPWRRSSHRATPGNGAIRCCSTGATFPEFGQLAGDIGARPIIQAHRDAIAWVDWPTPEILEDIDVAADYKSPAQG